MIIPRLGRGVAKRRGGLNILSGQPCGRRIIRNTLPTTSGPPRHGRGIFVYADT